MVGNINALGMSQLGSKSPNLQSVQSSMPNNLGGIGPMNSMAMSIANNGTIGSQPMNSMQGKNDWSLVVFAKF